MNDLTGTVVCLKRRCLLNICKLKRQTTTVRYSVAILCFGVMGPFVYCLATQAHGQLPDEISPKLCVVVGRVMKCSRGHLAIPRGICTILTFSK